MKRDAEASGEWHNVPEEPICPTEGRDALRRGFVASLIRCPASQCGPRRTTAQGISGQMVQSDRKMLWIAPRQSERAGANREDAGFW